jgi:glycosyl transferase, family 25
LKSDHDLLEIYVINLDRTPERFANFLTTNNVPGVKFTRVSAVDGQLLSRDQLIADKVIKEDLIFTTNSVACTLSHMKCWEIAIKTNKPITICEDDAVLHRDFGRINRLYTQQINPFDFIYWGYNLDMHVAYEVPGFGTCATIFNESHFHDKNNISTFQDATFNINIHRVVRLFGTPCYTISPAAARAMMARHQPLINRNGNFNMPNGWGKSTYLTVESWGIDMHLAVFETHEKAIYAVIPPIAISPNDKAQSTIGDGLRREG